MITSHSHTSMEVLSRCRTLNGEPYKNRTLEHMHDLICVPVEHHNPRHQHLGWAWNNVKPPETKSISRVASSSPVEQTYEYGNQSESKAAMRMGISFVFLASVLLGGSILINPADVTTTENSLTNAEKSSGWKLLFDGKTLKGWKIQ